MLIARSAQDEGAISGFGVGISAMRKSVAASAQEPLPRWGSALVWRKDLGFCR